MRKGRLPRSIHGSGQPSQEAGEGGSEFPQELVEEALEEYERRRKLGHFPIAFRGMA